MALQQPGGLTDARLTAQGLLEIGPDRGLVLAMRRRCQLCGCRVNGPVFTVDYSGDDPSYWVDDGLHITKAPVPMHLSCALYSASVCPLLRSPNGKHSTGGRRGDAVVIGASSYGIRTDGEVALWNFCHFHEYRTGTELAGDYTEALNNDQVNTATRMFWTDDDERELRQLCSRAPLAIQAGSRPVTIGDQTYRMFVP